MLAVILAMLLDWMQARFHEGAYYWTESLLFNTYWILFLPVGMLLQQKSIHFLKKLLLAVVLHAMVYALLVQTLSMLLLDHTYFFSHTLEYTSFNDFYKYFLVYGLVFYWQPRSISTSLTNPVPPSPGPEGLTIKEGRQQFQLPYSSITYIRSERPYIAINTKEKQFLHLESLSGIAQQLPADQFFRIHKSVIVQVAAIQSLRSRGNGDYDVLLMDGTELRMSRRFVQEFKSLPGSGKLFR